MKISAVNHANFYKTSTRYLKTISVIVKRALPDEAVLASVQVTNPLEGKQSLVCIKVASRTCDATRNDDPN